MKARTQKNLIDLPDMFGMDDMAALLGLSRRTIQTELLARTFEPAPIRNRKPYRWSKAAVQKWLENNGDMRRSRRAA